MKAASLLAVTLACVAVLARPADAQLGSGVRSDVRGLGIGVQLNGTGVQSATSRNVTGAGLGLTLSYGTSDALSLFARGSTGYRSSQLDVGARYRLGGPASALRPYVEGAVTAMGALRAAPEGEDTRTSLGSRGLGITVGAGVEYYVSRNFALDAGVAHTQGRFNTPAVGGANIRESLSSSRIQMGVTWRP